MTIQEHRLLHQQHESMFEREYMRAIYEAFIYQRNMVKDPVDFTGQPITAKLNGMWEIIKTSKAKYQKKFLYNYRSKIDFDPWTRGQQRDPPPRGAGWEPTAFVAVELNGSQSNKILGSTGPGNAAPRSVMLIDENERPLTNNVVRKT